MGLREKGYRLVCLVVEEMDAPFWGAEDGNMEVIKKRRLSKSLMREMWWEQYIREMSPL